jgi:hypothetical protein
MAMMSKTIKESEANLVECNREISGLKMFPDNLLVLLDAGIRPENMSQWLTCLVARDSKLDEIHFLLELSKSCQKHKHKGYLEFLTKKDNTFETLKILCKMAELSVEVVDLSFCYDFFKSNGESAEDL